jgi:hypothetical protein
MQAVRLTPVLLSFVVLAAHFSRAGETALAGVVLGLPLLLVLRRRWVVRVLELVLALGALEWVRTMVRLVDLRRAHGLPWLRLVAILGAVAAVTLVSALLVEAWWRARRPVPVLSEAT